MSTPLKSIHFGTDGIRGIYNQFPLQPKVIAQFTQALVSWLTVHKRVPQPKLVVCRDTRASGEEILQTIIANAHQAVVIDMGILPTAATAFYCCHAEADMGIMITASHNPHEYNGLKLFNSTDGKFSADEEQAMLNYIRHFAEKQSPHSAVLDNHQQQARQSYLRYLYQIYCKQCDQQRPQLPHKIVVDCANGASYDVVFRLLDQLDIQYIATNNQPNGHNINDQCGSTYAEKLCDAVLHNHADMGIAFDGDADRIILCDDQGRIIDGDLILLMLAPMFTQPTADDPAQGVEGVVGTLMTNLFVEQYFAQQNIPFVRTQVGDKFVADELKSRGWQLGSEPSGHVLLPSLSLSGDALVVLIVVLAHLRNQQMSLRAACADFVCYPQTQINVPVDHVSIAQSVIVQQALLKFQKQYTQCRILLRPSGTEPVVRVMCEGEDAKLNQTICDELASIVSEASV